MDRRSRKTIAQKLSGGTEVRLVPNCGLELREVGGQVRLQGWASITGHAYSMGAYDEVIRRGAFAQTLARNPDVQLLLNHQSLPLARTRSGTLRLSEDERGLRVDADLNPDDPDVQRVLPKVARGDIDQMSFAFHDARSEWDDDYTRREIVSLDIHRGDVSIVNQGANDATSFAMRSLLEQLARLEGSGDTPRRHPLSTYQRWAYAMRLADGKVKPDKRALLAGNAQKQRRHPLSTYQAWAYAMRLGDGNAKSSKKPPLTPEQQAIKDIVRRKLAQARRERGYR